eukprot:TRINITY_DN20883_c0_g1_i1.p1 TRINITY_DN20883_c0_g1~~TRINITY_DN20883_c0_g1_i1.p1  ORF type:complete len:409 (+),score=69.22 TRINITY_DN20883_c0_g1_i1:167-1228(+)
MSRYGIESPCVADSLFVEYAVLSCGGIAFMCYAMEVLNRKDYIQAAMIRKDKMRSDMLLRNILPDVIIDQLKDATSSTALAQNFDSITVLFADVVSFTTMSAQVSAQALVECLNHMFQRIDALAEKNGAEKIKTIGDCYMAAAGLPVPNPNHAQTMARFGLGMLELMASGELKNPATGENIQIRAGIHSGPAVAGVIGTKKFAYDVWGDAVNTASRMESHGQVMRLHCSEATHVLLKDDFVCEPQAKMEVKGKGLMQTYFVVSERSSAQYKSFVTHVPSEDLRIDDLAGSFETRHSADAGESNASTSKPSAIARLSKLGQFVTSLGYEVRDGEQNASRSSVESVELRMVDESR